MKNLRIKISDPSDKNLRLYMVKYDITSKEKAIEDILSKLDIDLK